MNEEDFRKIMDNATVAKITSPSGEVTNLTGKEVKESGLPGSLPGTGPTPVYKTESGWSLKPEDALTDTSVSLDKNTGKITVKAPSIALQNETFKTSISDTLKTISANYKINPDYKYAITDESGETKEKTVQDIIDDLNKPAKNEDGSYNQNSISYMATAAAGIERQKKAHAKNIELDDADVMRMNTIAVGPDVKDNSLQLISNLPEAEWLRNVSTYDKETGFAEFKDIMENAYNKEKTSSEDMIKLWAALENYFAKGDFGNKEEYIRNVATARFLDATQPNMSWIRDVTENVNGFLNGIGGFATELGTAGWVAVERLGGAIFGLTDEYYDVYGEDYGDLSVVRGGNQFATDMPMEKVDAKIGRIRFDADGVPSYVEESIAGGIENPRTTGEMMRAVFKENQAVIRKDMEYLHESQAAWDAVGYQLTSLAALISAGNVLSDVFVAGAGALTGKIGVVAGETISSVNDITSTANALYASGSMLNFGTTATEAAQIVSGMQTIYDIAASTGKAAEFLNFIGQAVSSAKATEAIIGVVGESVAEAVVGDNNRFIEVLQNQNIDPETKTYLVETYIGNALGWGVGLGASKFLIKAGDTTRGRAISANLSRRMFKIQNSVGDAFDTAILKIRRIEGDDLADKIKTLYEKDSKFAKKQANALAANAMLREMRGVIADSDSIKIAGKSTDEINEALQEIESKIIDLQNAEISLNSMQRQGMDIVQGWLKDNGLGLGEVTENFYSKASKISDLEKAAGDMFKPTKGAVTNLTEGKTIRLFSQTTTNYIKASEKIDFINAYIQKYEHAADVTQDVLRKIDAYRKELPTLQDMVDTFTKNATPELKLAADNFIDADRKWWAKFEDLRAKNGLTSMDELRGMRGSGLWGSNGELYARTARKSDLSEYVVKHRDGANNVKTFDTYEQYMAGAEGDFADPMGEMQIALYDAGNKQAYRSFTRSYDALTGSLTVKVSGEDTAFLTKMKKSLEHTYFESSETFLSGIANDVQSKGVIEDVIRNLRLKNQTYGDIAKARAAMKKATRNAEKKLNTVTSDNAGKFILRLGVEDTDALWDDFYDVSVRELLKDGEGFVPSQARRFIFGKARELGIDVPERNIISSISESSEAYEEAESIRRILQNNQQEIIERGPKTDPIKTISGLSYDERKKLAESVVAQNPDEYTLLYRVQGGKPDKWRPNNRGKKGKFEGKVGEYKGYVWLTSDSDWAEGPQRASAGVERESGIGKLKGAKVTNENIIVLPVKKSDIKDFSREGESVAMQALDSGQKIVQSRGNSITNGTEFILNGERNPEIFNDAMNTMLEEYNKQFDNRINRRAIENLRRESDSLAEELANIGQEGASYNAMRGLKISRENRMAGIYDEINKSLTGTADTPDMVFEQQVKRLIMSHNDEILDDTRVQTALTDRQIITNRIKQENFYRDKEAELKFLEEQYGITKEELSVAGGTTVQGYIDSMTRKGTGQRAAIDELCRYYGVEGDQNALEYFALSAYMDNREKYKNEIKDRVRKAIEKEHSEFDIKQAKRVTNIITDGVDTTIEEEFNDAYLTLKELNPNAVRDTDEKVMKEVDRIAKEIEGAEANRYAGEKNVIAMRNMQGQVEYYEVDPLLARLTNFQYSSQKLNGITQAIYNTNYLWTKLFRLGTTAINLKSMVSQSFRDPINMFIGGGAYRTMQQSMDDIVDVAGDDVVAWLKTNEPEALARLQKISSETGENIQELAVKREFSLGRAIAPGATETSMYKSLSTAKSARFNGAQDIYDDTTGDKFVRGISKVEDTLGKANEWRETTLRNLSYQNGLAKALKRGYSLDQARTYATFVMNEATTNFTRMTNHLVSIKETVPYFGSAINGTKSFYKLLSMDPVGVVGRLVGGLIIPAMALTTYSLMDEENKKVYKNIPEYQKEDSLVFVVEGQIITIPIPQELGSFIAPFRQTIESMNGVATNTFAQFAWNDILGFSPIDLSGFADLDFAKLEQSSPGFLDRIGRGTSKLWSQLAPAPLKSGLEIITGVDPYTGKEIDKSYLDYDENGNPIIKDYKSGQIAKALNDMFRSWGLSSSAPVIQNILSNIFGQASVDITDFLVSLASAVPNGGIDWTVDAKQLSTGEGYNPFYVLEQRLTSPVVAEAYDEAQSAWKSEVAKLYNMKSEILRSEEWREYKEAKSKTDDPEKLKNINASKKDILENYFNTVRNVVNNLQANYGEEFTAAKYATVLSLMTMEEQTLDAGSYGDYLNKEEFKTARAQAIQTMINLGFPSSSSMDILGKFVTDSNGNVQVKTYSPLAILQLDDTSGAAISAQSNRQNYAVIRNLIGESSIYGLREQYYKDVDKAYDEKNYDEVERLVNDYNKEVIKVINPYIQQYGPESVLQGDVMDYLEDYIMVPSSFMGRGKYYSSKTGLNKQQGYARNYIKAIFNYGGNKINGN